MQELITDLLSVVIQGVVLTLLGIGLQALKTWLQAKVDSERLDAAIAEATDAVYTAVAEQSQVFVDALKAKGGFTPDAAREAAQAALQRTQQILSTRSQQILTEYKGDATAYLAAKIEEAVRADKTAKPMPLADGFDLTD